ncbi:DNA polymerase subunit gamma-2, mitochondrial-like isoform X2 [Branchiostoma floridae]|uniref:DNA polymerase subunit gamma-2, mitochondrial-like isoform X2 n=1 Tax=Branchiostoma floridae TaxID=7739 RepID=A0A9J7N9H8_BRAFL|nr:DNA polymerase subunit gamma-2, mitochondrial-like isoform X2 [Branchiostoma floridae]
MVSPKSAASVLEALVRLCKAHGYVYAVETAGQTVYNFGPLGAELRRNLLAEWWQSIVTTQDNVFGIENALYKSLPAQDAHRLYGETVEEAMQTVRPQFSQSLHHGVLSHYHSSLQLLNNKLPFGLAEVGRCFARTAAHEERFLYSAREMTAMSMLFFVPPKKSGAWFDLYQRQRMQWWRKFASSPSSFSVVDTETDMTYPTVNIQFTFPWGVDTVERISLRYDSDLLDLEKKTGLSYQGKDGRKTVVPHVLEMETYLERACLTYLLDGLTQINSRQMLRLHCRLAPYKVAVLPGRGTESQLREITDYIARDLRTAGIPCWYSADPQHSNEQQHARYDEMGVPFSVAVNENTIKTGITLVRNRDTTVKIFIALRRKSLSD